MDIAALLYLVILTVHSIIFSMCLWWAFAYPKRSTMFLCFTGLSAGIIINFIPPLFIRLGGLNTYLYCQHKWWFVLRHLPIAAVSIVILAIFISRVMEDGE